MVKRQFGNALRRALGDHQYQSRHDFWNTSEAIRAKRNALTTSDFLEASKHYCSVEYSTIGQTSVQSLIDAMSDVYDETDICLGCVSQKTHIKQLLNVILNRYSADPVLLAAAILHDMGKILINYGVDAEYVLMTSEPIDMPSSYNKGLGLNQIDWKFGHAEYMFSKIQGAVPYEVAWLVRHHNININQVRHLMTSKELKMTDQYLKPFQQAETSSKSLYRCPGVDMSLVIRLTDQYLPDHLCI